MTDFNGMLRSVYRGKRVLVTGHTGFKGTWLCEWLIGLGAEVRGLALPPETDALFHSLRLVERMKDAYVDINDAQAVAQVVKDFEPQVIFHLAAQALVRESYRMPISTWSTNVLGTARVLEAVRTSGLPCIVIVVTSDKCYENKGLGRSFQEDDPLGGHDPYSASKASAELVTSSYRDSFFSTGYPVAVASVRAGNVIGGGDWAKDRIVPDSIRALQAGKPIPVRNPRYTRPWQHVLEPLGGYLLLGSKLIQAKDQNAEKELARYTQAFNLGPEAEAHRTVQDLVEEILINWKGAWEQVSGQTNLPEAPLLSLDITKAGKVLGWRPRWSFAQGVAETVAWYRCFHELAASQKVPDMIEYTQRQIGDYSSK